MAFYSDQKRARSPKLGFSLKANLIEKGKMAYIGKKQTPCSKLTLREKENTGGTHAI